MKGQYNYKLIRKPISFTLAALVFTTILLWAWEKNPFADTLLLPCQRFPMPSIDFFGDFSNNSSKPMKTNGNFEGRDLHLNTAEDTKVVEKFGTAPIDSMYTFSPGMQESNGNVTSFQTKVCNYAKGRWVADSRRPLYSGLNVSSGYQKCGHVD